MFMRVAIKKTKLSNDMITKDEALNTIAVKYGYPNWDLARYNQPDLMKLLHEAMDLYASESNSHKHGVVQGLPTEQEISGASIEFCSDRIGFQAMSQVYFRKGARWVISKMSGSPTVAARSVGASVQCGKEENANGTNT